MLTEETPIAEAGLTTSRVYRIEVAVFLLLIVPSMVVSYFAVRQGNVAFPQTAFATIFFAIWAWCRSSCSSPGEIGSRCAVLVFAGITRQRTRRFRRFRRQPAIMAGVAPPAHSRHAYTPSACPTWTFFDYQLGR